MEVTIGMFIDDFPTYADVYRFSINNKIVITNLQHCETLYDNTNIK